MAMGALGESTETPYQPGDWGNLEWCNLDALSSQESVMLYNPCQYILGCILELLYSLQHYTKIRVSSKFSKGKDGERERERERLEGRRRGRGDEKFAARHPLPPCLLHLSLAGSQVLA